MVLECSYQIEPYGNTLLMVLNAITNTFVVLGCKSPNGDQGILSKSIPRYRVGLLVNRIIEFEVDTQAFLAQVI